MSTPPPPALPPSAPNATVLRWLLALAALGLVVMLGVLHQFDPARHGFYPGCTFHRLTGLNCPGCGGLRATHQLLHGHFGEAWHHNALVVLAGPGLAAWFALRAWRRSRGVPPRLTRGQTVWVWLILGGMLGFTLLRNLPFAPFSALSP